MKQHYGCAMHKSINIEEVRGAVYISDQGHIDCEINHPIHGWIPYTIAPDDEDMTIDNAQLISLIDAQGGPAPLTEEVRYERHAGVVRMLRDNLLQTHVDPIASNALRWSELSDDQRMQLSEFRQLLLEMPDQDGFPYTVSWPDVPGFAG